MRLFALVYVGAAASHLRGTQKGADAVAKGADAVADAVAGGREVSSDQNAKAGTAVGADAVVGGRDADAMTSDANTVALAALKLLLDAADPGDDDVEAAIAAFRDRLDAVCPSLDCWDDEVGAVPETRRAEALALLEDVLGAERVDAIFEDRDDEEDVEADVEEPFVSAHGPIDFDDEAEDWWLLHVGDSRYDPSVFAALWAGAASSEVWGISAAEDDDIYHSEYDIYEDESGDEDGESDDDMYDDGSNEGLADEGTRRRPEIGVFSGDVRAAPTTHAKPHATNHHDKTTQNKCGESQRCNRIISPARIARGFRSGWERKRFAPALAARPRTTYGWPDLSVGSLVHLTGTAADVFAMWDAFWGFDNGEGDRDAPAADFHDDAYQT